MVYPVSALSLKNTAFFLTFVSYDMVSVGNASQGRLPPILRHWILHECLNDEHEAANIEPTSLATTLRNPLNLVGYIE